ncbi:HTH domain protein [Thalassovita gelatinovora]|uniref:HTH domain protein n=1 Tax=Thalassovita gelatinovora TaxID=53501 RepID=A0A0P1F5U8_THAGE|nr:YafY family protein [Thalassovita gelatinovora]QIZ80822.1 YafY family transcriptional regulator [Thalassovita gelatinovora]CUH63233.1 HTH domain protein [Thalassovita gelatinovora]SEQ63833.1 Predicted DNA-binding transcriptional regulator YafY, contains an HTH and WYL domains [Thalassovita gelatinovora]
MRRADRLFQIVQYLRGGRLVTAAQLAEKLEVTPRTIYRDVADLIGSGVPIEGEAGVGYLMSDGYDLPPLMFSSDEIVALVTGARMIRAWGGTAMAAAAEEALVKINAVLPKAARDRAKEVQVHALALQGMTDDLRDLIDRVEAAANAHIRLQINYEDEAGTASSRSVRPLGLWFWGKIWTMVCWCELREDFRMFRLDRVQSLTERERFKPQPGQTLRDFYRLKAYNRRS